MGGETGRRRDGEKKEKEKNEKEKKEEKKKKKKKIVEMNWPGEPELFGEVFVPVQVFPPQSPNWLACN